jgi:hypothetical protein
MNETEAAASSEKGGEEVPLNTSEKKKTLKDVVLEGLEEKGKGKDYWLW